MTDAQTYFENQFLKREPVGVIYDNYPFEKKVGEAFYKRFLIRPDEVSGRIVVVGDITFIVRLREDNEIKYVRLLGECPYNGESALSKICYHDWEIGEMLVHFEPEADHMCTI